MSGQEDHQGPTTAVYDAIVLGAGVSGLVAASLLLESGRSRILILDEYNHVGGNHIDVNINGYTFDIGSFFFQDDSPFLKHFPEVASLYSSGEYTIGRLNPQGLVTRYPISLKDDVIGAGPIEWLRILASLALARTFGNPHVHALAFAEYWLGRYFVQRSGLAGYMRRFYGVAPDQIEAAFARKRMHWISSNATVGGVLRQRADAVQVKLNRELVRPRQGFHVIYDVVRSSLAARGATINLGEELLSLDRGTNGCISVRTARSISSAETVISTIPVNSALSLAGLGPVGGLNSVELLTLFYSHGGDRGFLPPVLYNFDNRGAWKRLTMHSDFYGRVDGRGYLSVEFNAAHVGASAEIANRDFREHVLAYGLFPGDIALEGSRRTPNAYPIYVAGATVAAETAVGKLREFGVLSFGRQGGFDYQPTGRVSTLVAERAISSLSY